MTKDLEPTTHQPNSEKVDAQDTIEIKVADHRLPAEDDHESLPQSRTLRRQMEIRESLKPKLEPEAEEKAAIPQEPKTREEKRKAEQDEGKSARKKNRQLKVRLIPIWLRILIIILLCLIAVVAGAMIGYGVLGKGNPMDVFNEHTWTHIRDIVTKTK